MQPEEFELISQTQTSTDLSLTSRRKVTELSSLGTISSVANIDFYLSKREMASRLLHLLCSTPDRAVRVGALAADTALCSWGRHTVFLPTQVYKWILANLMLGVIPAMDYNPILGGEEILLVASWYKNRDKRRSDGSYANFTLFLKYINFHFCDFRVLTSCVSILIGHWLGTGTSC